MEVGQTSGHWVIAKEHHHHLAREVLQAALLAVVVGQWKIAGVVGASDVHTAKFGFLSEQAPKRPAAPAIKRKQLSI
jgi:hypothetical protein